MKIIDTPKRQMKFKVYRDDNPNDVVNKIMPIFEQFGYAIDIISPNDVEYIEYKIKLK